MALYFEVVSTLALIVGLVMINLVQPGAGMHIDVNALDTKGIAAYTAPGKCRQRPSF
jgi:aerobic C4-dicarboxylate transport protein